MTFKPYTRYRPPAPGSRYFNEEGTPYGRTPMETSVMTPLISAADFASKTVTGITLVDFWAPWCGSCKNLMPILEGLSSSYPQVKFVKVNADDLPDLCEHWGITSLPTLLMFKEGQMVNKHVGALSRSQLKDFIEAML